ncbi:MAG: hypothetical protein ChlgKO_13270 [Chlamydiales bacterium]
MSALIPINQQGMGLHVVGVQSDSKSVILSCNGIQNSLEDAKEMGWSISEKFGGKQVHVFHNPTNFFQYLDSKKREHQEAKLVRALAVNIYRLLDGKESMQIFAHSHGTVLVEKALRVIDKVRGLGRKSTKKIEVHAFGGATIISNRLAGKVHNYIFERDEIAKLGNVISGPQHILETIETINRIMHEKGISRKEAINEKVRQEQSHSALPDNQVLSENLGFAAKVKRYHSLFKRYNVLFLKSPAIEHPGCAELGEASLFENFVIEISDIFQNHTFTSYAHVVDQIAQKEVRRMK